MECWTGRYRGLLRLQVFLALLLCAPGPVAADGLPDPDRRLQALLDAAVARFNIPPNRLSIGPGFKGKGAASVEVMAAP